MFPHQNHLFLQISKKVLDNHSKVFETPKGLPPIHDHDHAIHLILGSVPPNIRLYRYPYAQNSEIECMVAEMLEASIIQEGWIMLHKKDGSWRMCLDYRELDKLTVMRKELFLLTKLTSLGV